MNPNDPRFRLQVLNSSSPSIRLATAPANQPKLTVSTQNTQQQPNIILPDGSQAPQGNDNSYVSPVVQAPQHTSFLDKVGEATKAIASPFVNVGEDVSNTIGNAEVKAGEALGFTPKTGTQTNQQQFGQINNDLGIQTQNDDLRHFAGNLLQVAPAVAAVAAAPFTGGGSLAADAALEGGAAAGGGLLEGAATDAALGGVAGAGQTLANDKQHNSLGDYIKNIGIGSALGGVGRVVGNGIGAVAKPIFNSLTGRTAADALPQALADTTDAGTVQSALNTTPEVSKFIAQETDPNVIKQVLNEVSGLHPKSALSSLEQKGAEDAVDDAATTAANKNDKSQSPISILDENNPLQSQLPAGWHPDGAADPVPVLQKAAQGSSQADFESYFNGLTGEDKAAATSALDGMTPDEFYAKAGGGSQVATHTTSEGLTSQVDPDIAKAGLVQGGISDAPINNLTLGADANASEAPDMAQVSKYINDIKNGKGINPLIANKDADGNLSIIQDGRHRLEALKAMGNKVAPVIEAGEKNGGTTMADLATATPEGAAEATNAAAPSTTAPGTAVQNVLDNLHNATRQYNVAASARTAEKGARSAQADAAFESAGGGQAGYAAKMAALKGEYSKSGYGIDINPDDMSSMLNDVQNNPNLAKWEKTNAQVALHKLSSDTPQGPTPSDISALRKAFGDNLADAAVDNTQAAKTGGQKVLDALGQVAGAPKSIMASGDVSAAGRQGAILSARHPILAGKAFGQQFKYMFSNDAFKNDMAEIASRPSYQSMVDSKLAVTGTEALDKNEEQYVSTLAEKIPGLGHVVAGSDRAFTGFLTNLRANVFDQVVNANKAVGNDLGQKDLDDLARVINTSSGRGDLGKYLEQHSQTLSTALFSPRLWKSRLDVLNPVYYAKLAPVARKEALQDAGAFATAAGAVLGLMSKVPGVTVSTDPKNADFLKIKYQNTRYDILGGLQQNLVFAAREASGETTNSQTGVSEKLGSTYGGDTRLSVLGNLVQNKENPLFSAASQILQGKDRGGNPVNPLTTVGQLAVPLPLSGIYQIAQDRGSVGNVKNDLEATALDAPDEVGFSDQTYGATPTKNQGQPTANGTPTFKGTATPNMVTDYNGKVLMNPTTGAPYTVKFPAGANATAKAAILESARETDTKSQYTAGLPEQTQALMKLSDSQLAGYVKSGQITQQQYDNVKNVQKTAESVSQNNQYTVPAGAKSTEAQTFYSHYNSMDAKDQAVYLNQKPDANSTAIATSLNAQRQPGLNAFTPSNKLAQLYSAYENDVNTHNGSDPTKQQYSALDLQNKSKAFNVAAAKLNYNSDVNDIYTEGGSVDLKSLMDDGKISKSDLNSAVALDNELYNAGLTSSLKFSKSFRTANGFGTPASNGTSSSSGSDSTGGEAFSQQLTGLVPTLNSSPAGKLAKFSPAGKALPAPVKFKVPAGAMPGSPSAPVRIASFNEPRTAAALGKALVE